MAWERANIEDFAPLPNAKATRTEENEFNNYLISHRFSHDMPLPDDEALLTYNGIPIGNRGNIVAINGRAKSRKSVVASAMTSAFFTNDQFLGFESVGNRTRTVLHFDTEQGPSHYRASGRRVYENIGLPAQPRTFHSYHCRDADIPFRIEFVERTIELHKPDVLVIDGITDLVFDINDQVEASTMGQKLMTWSVVYNCLIIVVIHVTKGNGNMTGALGTYLEKKCQTALTCVKEEENEDVTDVSCQYARDQGFRTFGIMFDEKLRHYVRIDDKNFIKKGPKGNYSPVEMRAEFDVQLFDMVFVGERVYKSDHEYRAAVKKNLETLAGSTVKTEYVTEWMNHFTHGTMKAMRNADGNVMRAAAFMNMKRAAPEIQFSQRELPQEHDEPENFRPADEGDDIPF